MSTRAIQELLEWAERGDSPHAAEARTELGALRKAAREVSRGNVYVQHTRTQEDALELFDRIAAESE